MKRAGLEPLILDYITHLSHPPFSLFNNTKIWSWFLVPFYRIYEYPCKTVSYRHVYIKRDRLSLQASENSKLILDKLEKQDKFQESISRARRTIRDIILCNRFDYFCTFTFNAEKVPRYDYRACKKYISQWFNNFKKRYAPDFKYIVIPEFHRDGAVHFHGMVAGIPPGELETPEWIYKKRKGTGELERVPNTPGYLDWPRWRKNAGWFNCSPVRDYERCAFYVTKYVTKDLQRLPKGERLFMASLSLNRPELVYDENDIPVLFEPTFENEYVVTAFQDREFSSMFLDSDTEPWVEIDFETGDLDAIFSHVWFRPMEGEQLVGFD